MKIIEQQMNLTKEIKMLQITEKENIKLDDHTLRMYAILRHDIFINIPNNIKYMKMAVMTGHAFKMLTRNLRHHPKLDEAYFEDGIGTNIILRAKGILQLEDAHRKAKEAGLFTSFITDEHHIIPGTAFDGKPIITCLAIGPALRKDIQHITKKFSASM